MWDDLKAYIPNWEDRIIGANDGYYRTARTASIDTKINEYPTANPWEQGVTDVEVDEHGDIYYKLGNLKFKIPQYEIHVDKSEVEEIALSEGLSIVI